ncbi:hypothetical protein ACN1C3_17170 [Pseudomonas sp. H11T01]|uniref:hypothetical protein n=1 Tax=Pseudomonas sp. H11T01 TaxID=3402749 RepID=UPI003AC7540A
MTTDYHVMLVAGNLLSISDELPDFMEGDVLNSLLFSQLFANNKAVKFASPGEWYKADAKAMTQVKWLGIDKNFMCFEPAKDSIVTLQELIKKSLRNHVNQQQGVQVDSMMVRRGRFPEEETVHALFRGQVINTVPAETDVPREGVKPAVSTIALQVGLVEPGPVLYSIFINFSTSEVIGVDVFSQHFSGENIVGSISVYFARRELDTKAYQKENIRGKILSALHDKKSELIFRVPS